MVVVALVTKDSNSCRRFHNQGPLHRVETRRADKCLRGTRQEVVDLNAADQKVREGKRLKLGQRRLYSEW